MCPGQRESGGKQHSTKARKGSKWLRGTLTESAKAVVRTKGTYLSARSTGSRAAADTPSHDRDRAPDPHRRLPRPGPRRSLPRTRRRVLLPPRHREHRTLPPTAHQTARTPRPQSHTRASPRRYLTPNHCRSPNATQGGCPIPRAANPQELFSIELSLEHRCVSGNAGPFCVLETERRCQPPMQSDRWGGELPP